MSEQIITRFAPSPTGFLHIGGARTALFNWLYARGRGGKMLLRIEDTDRSRSTEAAVDAILDGMRFMGLEWDGEAVSQFSRMARHAEVAHELLRTGHAYRCYATQEELEAMREAARLEGRSYAYDRRWRDRDASESPAGAPHVIRFKMPLEGETVIDDLVQGPVTFQNRDLEDLVILRSDGTPTYNLSVVVDDHDMGVTHIIRGDDHLINAAKQTLIYQAMGWKIPSMSHIPLIHGPDGAKMSKRHGALGVDAYRAMGYLPAALRSYLARLGWSHGDQEIFSTDDLLAHFDISNVNKAPSRFDFQKLENTNAHFMRAMEDGALMQAYMAFLPYIDGGSDFLQGLDETTRARLLAALPSGKARAKTLVDLHGYFGFIFRTRPLAIEGADASLLNDETRPYLAAVHDALGSLAEWTPHSLDASVKETVEKLGVKFGKVGQPLRIALAGTSAAPGITDILMIFGREESLARLRDAL